MLRLFLYFGVFYDAMMIVIYYDDVMIPFKYECRTIHWLCLQDLFLLETGKMLYVGSHPLPGNLVLY